MEEKSTIWILSFIVGVIYIMGFLSYVDSRNKSFEKDIDPIDVWISAMWPFCLLLTVIKIVTIPIHDAIALILLGLGVSYIKTQTYKSIKDWLDK